MTPARREETVKRIVVGFTVFLGAGGILVLPLVYQYRDQTIWAPGVAGRPAAVLNTPIGTSQAAVVASFGEPLRKTTEARPETWYYTLSESYQYPVGHYSWVVTFDAPRIEFDAEGRVTADVRSRPEFRVGQPRSKGIVGWDRAAVRQALGEPFVVKRGVVVECWDYTRPEHEDGRWYSLSLCFFEGRLVQKAADFTGPL